MQSPAEVAGIRAQLWESGFRPVAIYSHDHPHKDAGKAPLGREWRIRALQNPPDAVRFTPVSHALNTGILCDGLREIPLRYGGVV